jgi:hypothetical protein
MWTVTVVVPADSHFTDQFQIIPPPENEQMTLTYQQEQG